MPNRRLPLIVAAFVLGTFAFARHVAAQEQSFGRALELEDAGKFADAAAAYRAALATPNALPALLGLERVYAELGMTDSLLPVLDSAIRAEPRQPVYRSVELRALRSLGREDAARAAFERWLKDAPNDPTPYRDYARLLMQGERPQAADSVLQRAQRVFGSGREFAVELAQLRATMGLWEPAARSWRAAVAGSPFFLQAATFSLQPAPTPARETIRRALLAAPMEAGARRVLAALELGWGAPRDGWAAIRELPPDDSTVAAWGEFGDLAERAEAWLVARDAFAAAYEAKQTPALAARAAAAAIAGGDAAAALRLAEQASASLDSAVAAREVLPVRVRALTALGRSAEAEQAIAAYAASLDPEARAGLTRSIAWGWVRAGDIGRARAALAAAGEAEDGDAAGWLALYEGDLASARAALKHSEESGGEVVMAMAVLARTRAERAPAVGEAFLLLARGDSARAAARFAQAADAVPDAAPLLLAIGARLHAARKDDTAAIALWRTIVATHEQAPEAAEADLEWARALRRHGETAAAAVRLEHLILTYPQSALVPQARRELDLARRAEPGTA